MGYEFFSGCTSLTTVDLSGLSQLTTVGNHFKAWQLRCVGRVLPPGSPSLI